MSTGYGWEGIRQRLVRAMYLSASVVAVSTKGRYDKFSTFTFKTDSECHQPVLKQ